MKSLTRQFLKTTSSKNYYEVLKNSDVDWNDYNKKIPSNVSDPIQFFIFNYNKYPLVIPKVFDSSYYLEMNPDIREDGFNPLVHYLLFGREEGRAAWPSSLNETSKIEYAEKINVNSSNEVNDEDLIEESEQIEDASSIEDNPIKKKLKILLLEKNLLPDGFSPSQFDKWLDDLVEVSEYGEVKIPGFYDQKLYESIYQDIAHSSVNSFFHYISHGYEEGRLGCLDIDSLIVPGGKEKNESLSTVLVVSHEASATGAPVVALEVSKRLNKNFNIVTCALRGGELRSHFVDAGIAHLDAPAHLGIRALEYCLEQIVERLGVSALLLNSVESVEMAEAASNLGLPTASLLHEFAEYTRPVGKISRMLLASDMVIYPAKSLMNSGLCELHDVAGVRNKPNHIVIHPQGYLGFRSHDKKNWSLRQQLGLSINDLIIVGAGHVQPRKGVDWFLETCFYIREEMLNNNDARAENLHFVWLGNGYSENDTLVSVWLDAYIQRVGIKNKVHFPGAVHDVGSALREADLFLLTSRLDPFPNVAIDALYSDCGIGVFKESSGVADFVLENSARAALGRYGDPRDLAENIVKKFDELILKDGVNSSVCRKYLDFDNYISNLNIVINEALDRRKELSESGKLELFKNIFSSSFYSQDVDSDFKIRNHFLSLLRKGVAVTKPFPGSDIQKVLDNCSADDFPCLVEKAMTTTVEDMPIHMLSGVSTKKPYTGRVALQFHVYFADLIPEYCAYFKTLQDHDVDLFVSHIPNLDKEHIKQLAESVTGELYLRKFDNRGRDVYPFHRQFVDDIEGNYDVVGHFHTKKSGDIADGIGDRWRRYLLGNLMGSREASREVLSLFNDPRTGLIFAEDRHLVDEGDNGQYIESLLDQLDLQRRTHYRHFPLGTMFWARTEALAALKKWPKEIFNLPEPIPYDGSVLHAFERLLPQLVQEEGFEVKRVYTESTYW